MRITVPEQRVASVRAALDADRGYWAGVVGRHEGSDCDRAYYAKCVAWAATWLRTLPEIELGGEATAYLAAMLRFHAGRALAEHDHRRAGDLFTTLADLEDATGGRAPARTPGARHALV